MHKFIFLSLVVLLNACQHQQSHSSESSADAMSDMELEIARVFSDVDSLLELDNGSFWNKKLYGPFLIIDPETRVFYANQNSANNDFQQVGTVYRDTLPEELTIANTAIDWEGQRWSMIMQPLPESQMERNHLIVHELFHRIQPEIGYENLQELDNAHLDGDDGRVLLKLELQALLEAVADTDEAQRLRHIQNALTFRTKRQSTPEIAMAEHSLELNEGLAEYTALMLSGRNPEEMKDHLTSVTHQFYSNPTFVRSFAYQTIPLYGYLLSAIQPDWHQKINRTAHLTDVFAQAFALEIDTSVATEKIASQSNYGYEQIVAEETERENQRREKLAKLRAKFTAVSVLELPFENMNISFDPRNIVPLENLGTVYPNLTVTDNWGVLTVENEALLAPDWSKVTVSAPSEIKGQSVTGDGWQLELKSGWMVERAGDEYRLVRE